ncbi:MAG: flippase-like domain-containing protein [Bacteroidales bacterium]|nr:flippase-like domain-containing protein [Bacteroidales bacterium]
MTEKSNPLGIFKFNKIIIPILIGLGVGFFMISREYKQNTSLFYDLGSLFSTYSLLCLFIAILFELMREFMYMYRIRLLSDNQLSWKKAFQIIMLWEFSSTVTPTSIGGSAVALFIIPMEGISIGKSTAMVMVATLMDELFYIIIAPLTILLVGSNAAFATHFKFSFLGFQISELLVFFIGYGFMSLLSIAILLAMFFFPNKFRNFLYKLGKKKIFSKKKDKLEKLGDDVLVSSKEFKDKKALFWLKAYFSTLLSWTSRFLVLNFVLMAFNTNITTFFDNLLIYCRQLVMWIVLCITPTPGSSGVAEGAFPLFFHEFLPEGLQGVLALLWRLFTYYPYIIVGVFVLPYWTHRVYKQRQSKKEQAK